MIYEINPKNIPPYVEKRLALISGFINASEIGKKGIVFFVLRVNQKSRK